MSADAGAGTTTSKKQSTFKAAAVIVVRISVSEKKRTPQ